MTTGPYLEFDDLGISPAPEVGPGGAVEVSVVTGGEAESIPRAVTVLKYVAEGTEIYRYGGRTYAVPANSFLVLPEGHRGEATMDRAQGPAIGMCVFLPQREGTPLDANGTPLEAPVVFPAKCSALGTLLGTTHRALFTAHATKRPAIAQSLLERLDAGMDALLGDAAGALSEFASVKRATRLEHLRRLNVARHHLHEITDRAVNLAELARRSGMSRFQLARLFTQAFGDSPASYHRTVRLEAAREELRVGDASCLDVAHAYGFADSAHFSRAYKSRFGEPPSVFRAR